MRRPRRPSPAGATVAGGLLAAVLLAGCSTTPLPTGAGAVTPAARPSDLAAQREAAGIADCPTTPLEAEPVEGGLPDLVLTCLGSQRQVNLAALRGPMVINLWAQWCAPCRVEAPFLREFAELAGDQVVVLGIDYADPDPSVALEFAQYVGWTHAHLSDPLKQTSGPLQISGIPVTLFVAADGTIAYRHTGELASTDQVRELAAQYLGVTL